MQVVSIIIPACNDEFLDKTVRMLLAKAKGNIEVIVVLDGPTEFPLRVKDPRLTVKSLPVQGGLKRAVNLGLDIATGDYIFKVDAHCDFSDGYDESLKGDYVDNSLMFPRRYTLNVANWERMIDERHQPIDYFYIGCPWGTKNGKRMVVSPWIRRSKERKDIMIDESLMFHGSAWFISRKYFDKLFGRLDEKHGWWAEQMELGMKIWLTGGRILVNKNVWYAHAHIRDKAYYVGIHNLVKSHEYWSGQAFNNKIRGQIYDFGWLIDKFWPLPTEHNKMRGERHLWPENWRDNYQPDMFKFSGDFESLSQEPIPYGKHSYFIPDNKTMAKYSDFKIPKRYGVKLFKHNSWQGTDFYDAAVIENIFWLNGIAPKVRKVIRFLTDKGEMYYAHLVEIMGNTKYKNLKQMERVAKDNFIKINYGGGDDEPNHNRNWRRGKYIDFGGFQLDKESYIKKEGHIPSVVARFL